jgi:hypothetical protein
MPTTCHTEEKEVNDATAIHPTPGQCLIVQEGFVYWSSPPSSLEKATQYSTLPRKDCILLLDFFQGKSFNYWKAITLNDNKIVYTTTTNLKLSLVLEPEAA